MDLVSSSDINVLISPLIKHTDPDPTTYHIKEENVLGKVWILLGVLNHI